MHACEMEYILSGGDKLVRLNSLQTDYASYEEMD